MTLPDYLATLPADARHRFRKSVLALTGIRPAAWYQWLNGTTQPSPRHALCVERLSAGRVTLRDLRPRDYL